MTSPVPDWITKDEEPRLAAYLVRRVCGRAAGSFEPECTTSRRLHALIRAAAPGLVPRTFYGMPAYARDGKVVVFFRDALKFKERYMTIGFTQQARLDAGAMWPTAFALTELTDALEAKIDALVRRAAR